MVDEREEPRISLNQLTEYLVANSARRKRIIEQQKRPSDFQVIYYQEAQEAIQKFLASNFSNEDSLVSLVDEIYARSPKSEFEESRNSSNAEAIASFLEFYEDIDFGGLKPKSAGNDQSKMRLGGLDLSVRPEIILKGDMPKHGKCVGAFKLYFSKREQSKLTADSGKYPASILYKYVAMQHPRRKVLHSVCTVIDVFGQKTFCAPRAHKRAMADVEVACEEIAMWWERV